MTQDRLLPEKPVKTVKQHVREKLRNQPLRQAERKRRRRGGRRRPRPQVEQGKLELE